jgi:chromosome segregation protein
MTRQARLVALELEAFRGFAATRSLDLDADVVLVRGDNGTGKTSVADGMLWLFTGAIPRLTERAKGLRKGEDPIVNRYRSAGPARVRLTLAMADGRYVVFERQGRADRSDLAAWDGDEELCNAPELLAQAFGDLTPDQMVQGVQSWGILQQHALLRALDSGVALHQRLAEVVGLERVTRFANSAGDVAKQLARERKRLEGVRDSLRQRRTAAASRLATARAEAAEPVDAQARLSSLVGACTAELPEGLAVARPVASLDELAALGREAGAGMEYADELASAVEGVESARSEIADAVDGVERELTSLMKRAETAVRRAPAQVQLAGAALELLGDECPVCGQPIDAASVRKHLLELLETAETQATAAADAQRAVVEAQSRLQLARLAEERRATAQQRLDVAANHLRERLVATSWLEVDAPWRTADRAAALADHLGRFQSRLREAYAEARRDTGEQIARLSSEVEASDAELERTDVEVAELGGRADRAAVLDKAAHEAAQRIVERALQRLAPSFAEVFDRLSPHPTFTELRATQDIFYGKNQVVPEVYDPDYKVAANPALIFSEGQLNVVALSYFLGLALNAGDGSLPFVVLDDPLQTMDVLSVLGFADLCRRLREHRQLIVTTHDRRFASLLGRKLAPREADTRTILHEFEGWTADGPHVRSSDEPLADIIPLFARRAS